MTLSAADAHAQANSHVAAMMAAAMRADIVAIGVVVEKAGGSGGLDDPGSLRRTSRKSGSQT